MPKKRGTTSLGGGDQAVELLRAIWSEMKALNARIDQTREDLGQRLDAVRAELKQESAAQRQRITDSELRLASATAQLASDVQGLTKLIRDWREEQLDMRVKRLEEWRAQMEAGR